MSCQNFDKAVHYAKAAFQDALETEELKDETLSLLFHYYQGLKSISIKKRTEEFIIIQYANQQEI